MFRRLVSGVKHWLEEAPPQERRRAPRVPDPSILVYYWDGSVPEGRRLRDVSSTGAYVITQERWYVGTVIRLILQAYKIAPESQGAIVAHKSTSIPSRVVRHGSDGVAVQFLFSTPEEREALEAFLATIPKVAASGAVSPPRGQALVEFALILPLLFLLVVNAVNFGGFLFAWITVANAARAGAQYAVRSGATLGSPRPPIAAQVTTLVTNDISSLLNRASLAVRVCTNNNGVIACAGSGTGVPDPDPEPTRYVLASVDVTYTYNPYLAQWSFPNLGIHATLPATTIHRRASLRMLQ